MPVPNSDAVITTLLQPSELFPWSIPTWDQWSTGVGLLQAVEAVEEAEARLP